MLHKRFDPFFCLFSIESFDQAKNPILIPGVLRGDDEKIVFDMRSIRCPCSNLKGDQRSRIRESIAVFIGMSVPRFFVDPAQEMFFMFGDELFDSSFAYPFRSSNRQHPVMADSNRDPTIRPGGEQSVLNRSYFTGAFHFARVASMRIMNLSLRQNLAYQKLPYEGSSAEAAYRTLIAFLDQAPIGSEGILLLSSEMDVLFLGTTDPLDEGTLEKIAKAEKLDPVYGDHILESGRYHFVQLPLPSSIEELPMEELVLNEGDLLYLRILKEGSLAPVAQLWVKRKAV